MSLLGERRNVSGVVLRVGNSRLPHESLARKTLDLVLRPRAASIVGKLCQVVHGHNAELADFFTVDRCNRSIFSFSFSRKRRSVSLPGVR